MAAANGVRARGAAGLRRLAFLSLVSIPLALELVLGELLFAGHVVLLVEALGLLWGSVAFILLWAALGLLVLAASDSLWPAMRSAFDRLRSRLNRLLEGATTRALLLVAAALLTAAAAALSLALAGADAWGWAADHRADLAMFLLVVVVVFLALLAVARAGRGLTGWVRSIGRDAGPAGRSFATLVSMALLGPALAWPLLRLLGYSRRTEYVLTLASAPLFGLLWVPFYALGVWEIVNGLF